MKRRAMITGLLLAGCASDVVRPAATPKSKEPVAPVAADIDEETGPLRLVSGVWSPFTDEEGKPRLAVDLVRLALSRAGHEAESQVVHPQELMPGLEEGKFDGSEALWLSEERLSYLIYSRPYLENRLVLLARHGTPVKARRVEELKEKTLGIVADYAYGPEVLDAMGPTLVKGKSDADNVRALLKGEVDYVLVDELLVYYLFEYERERASRLLVAGSIPMTTRSLHFALRRDVPGAEAIIEDFNAQIQGMLRDGSYNDILKVGWLLADIDGDGEPEYILGGRSAGSEPPQAPYRLGTRDSQGTVRAKPRFVIDGQEYSDWRSVPQQYKVPASEPEDPAGRFEAGINLVLLEF